MTRSQRTAVGVVLALYGVIMIVANARNGFLPSSYTRDFVLFGSSTDIPGDLGRSVFTGSVALGIVIIVLAVVLWFVAGSRAAVPVGAVSVLVALVLLLAYHGSGNLLAARPPAAAVIAAAGLLLISSVLPERTGEGARHGSR